MIESRRCPRATPQRSSTHAPESSGPRYAMAAAIRSARACSSSKLPPPASMNPAIPHMFSSERSIAPGSPNPAEYPYHWLRRAGRCSPGQPGARPIELTTGRVVSIGQKKSNRALNGHISGPSDLPRLRASRSADTSNCVPNRGSIESHWPPRQLVTCVRCRRKAEPRCVGESLPVAQNCGMLRTPHIHRMVGGLPFWLLGRERRKPGRRRLGRNSRRDALLRRRRRCESRQHGGR